jgi:hypothetical protein
VIRREGVLLDLEDGGLTFVGSLNLATAIRTCELHGVGGLTPSCAHCWSRWPATPTPMAA